MTDILQDRQLRSVNTLIDCNFLSKEGEKLGNVRDFFIDDESWAVRYLVVASKGWLKRDELLISPHVLEDPEFGSRSPEIPSRFSKEDFEKSPPVESDEPISRQYEEELARFHHYPGYWEGQALWGLSGHPIVAPPGPEEVMEHQKRVDEIQASHLRSAEELKNYRVKAGNGEVVGKLDDFIVETQSWKIRYLVVKTGHILNRQYSIFSPDWITGISLPDQCVEFANLSPEVIEGAPDFNYTAGINADDEGRLYDYYGKRIYW